MQGTDQRAYDRASTVFSPDGRLYQVDYAREAVGRGSAAVGVRSPEGVALAADRRLRSPLQVGESVEKIHAIDDDVAAASAGHAADARQLADRARRRAQGERLRFGEPPGVEPLAKTLGDHVQETTQTGGTRPYGAALLLAGVADHPRLFEVDPSGTPVEWTAVAVGDGATEARSHLEAAGEAATLDDAVEAAVGALAAADERNRPPEELALATVDRDGVDRVGRERRRERLAQGGILDGAAS